MGNRIEADPDADPEQDVFGFVSEGIDHAGLLALRAPRPTLLGTARFDFFPIEGARESFAQAQKHYEVAGVGDRIERAEAAEKHGLSRPLRQAVYGWFERWLAERKDAVVEEIAVAPRSAKELLVCPEGQVNVSFRSRPLLPLALEEFDKKKKLLRMALRDLLGLDAKLADFHLTEVAVKEGQTILVCINGNETPDFREEKDFLDALVKEGYAVVVVDPRGVGKLRPDITVKGHDYADPLVGVEENIAYNAFLVGRSLLGMRVSDVIEAVRKITAKMKPKQVVLCGRRDAALVCCMAAAVEPAVKQVATEELLLSFLTLFEVGGLAINAASILPGMLRNFGDVGDVLAEIAPRKVLVAAGVGKGPRLPSVAIAEERFTKDARLLLEWLGS
jgi:hypothetical protein